MKFTSASNSGERYQVVPPLFFNADIIGVLDGKTVLGSVGRKSFVSYRLENRTSFQHPVIGCIVGVGVVAIPVQSILGDPLGLLWLTFGSCTGMAGSLFLIIFGISLLVGVIRRRDEPWLVLVTARGERAFPIRTELSAEAEDLLRSFCDQPPDMERQIQPCVGCGYSLIGNVSGVCPECGRAIK